ncbi:DNA-formamidopyrimidine glycosylase family protein, partial [Microbacterium sp. GbtcB4]|uniref:DNA-formamidopyrimidine glycosylase family protein n=1 Tax=Microbacterium sp. GbtcB4 TaxID=2824749 RepID=UPI0034D3B535
SALGGAATPGAERRGKFVVLPCGSELHPVFHLAKAGWLRWYDTLPTTLLKPGKTLIALRIALDDGSGFDLTEAGTK